MSPLRSPSRRWRALWFLPFLLSAAMTSFLPTGQAQAEPNFLQGFLTWQNGKAIFVWDEKQATGTGVTAFPERTLQENVALKEVWKRRSEQGPAVTPPSPDVLEWQPLPHAVTFTPGRAIFFTLGLDCMVAVEVRLFTSDGSLVGSTSSPVQGFSQTTMLWNPRNGENGWAYDGTTGCTPRREYLSLWPEVDTLPAGTTLRLEVRQPDYHRAQYLTSGPRRTTVTIYFESPAQAAERGSVMGPDDLPPEEYAAAAAILPLALVPWRRRAVIGVAGGAALLLAGCLGGQSPTAAPAGSEEMPGRIDVSAVDGGDGATTIVHGSVANEVGQAIAHARVALLDTPFSAFTEPHGSFGFDSVPPGTYRLRVDRVGYESLEKSIEIVAGKTNVIKITMRPVGYAGAESIAHRHAGHWQGKTRLEVFNGSVTITTNGRDPHACGFNEACHPAQITLPRGTIVPPGTFVIEARVSWPSANQLGFVSVFTNGMNQWAKASGDVTRFQVGDQMTDDGHRTYSQWTFQIRPVRYTPDTELRVPQPLHVTLTLLRGRIPLEPGHVDYWKGNDTLRLLDYAPPSAWKLPPVPTGTTWLSAVLEQNWDSAQDYTVNHTTADPRHPEGPLPEHKREGTKVTFRRIVCPEDADDVYRRESAWKLTLVPVPLSTVERETAKALDELERGHPQTSPYGIGNGALDWRLTVDVHRTPWHGQGGCA